MWQIYSKLRRHQRIIFFSVMSICILVWMVRPNGQAGLQTHNLKYPYVHPSWTSQNTSIFQPEPNSSVKYLAFLPHSGFHNQRIELENALILAYLLNRTLVLPLARLGSNPLTYKSFDTLSTAYSRSDKSWLAHCEGNDLRANGKECRKYERYTHISWQDIVDVPRLAKLVPLVERWNFSSTWFQDDLHVKSDQIYWLKDEYAYEYQFYESLDGTTHDRKYEKRLDISTLRDDAIRSRLIHVGTLFGTSRLRLSHNSTLLFREQVKDLMSLSNSYLLHLAERISMRMGGINAYFSVHVRVGDGRFALESAENVRNIWWTLLVRGYGIKEVHIREIERRVTIRVSGIVVPRVDGGLPNHTSRRAILQSGAMLHSNLCRKPLYVREELKILNTPLYIATDAKPESRSDTLHLFMETFPCVFFLSDFQANLVDLQDEVNPLDHSRLLPFLLPFLDALVASMSSMVIGTPESTYSRYVEDILWPAQHGLNSLNISRDEVE